VAVVIDVGSGGSPGVGVGQTSSGSGVVAIAWEPVIANSGARGLTCLVSQVNPMQPRPRACSMLLSSD